MIHTVSIPVSDPVTYLNKRSKTTSEREMLRKRYKEKENKMMKIKPRLTEKKRKTKAMV